ncbi:hypothetical protein [Mycolicibacterium bacteremicum]|uniref:hypothetical protein n=1 Tax=Mycolicibacterium bacteremicum TaxID=564198 RepID=UPI001054ECAB|nr:hypothetical protein [Mycolicibacterium bacteremicum]MCV7431439.1 hypothetical protein [Mycolicibacterium bacteremicum]
MQVPRWAVVLRAQQVLRAQESWTQREWRRVVEVLPAGPRWRTQPHESAEEVPRAPVKVVAEHPVERPVVPRFIRPRVRRLRRVRLPAHSSTRPLWRPRPRSRCLSPQRR